MPGPKPDARITPTDDEFQSWCLHPVTRYVAEAFRIGAERQRQQWQRLFEANIIPADLSQQRLELRTREDAYRVILENDLSDYERIIEPGPPASSAARGSHWVDRGLVRPDGSRRLESRKDRGSAA